ncbi:hypothetical protein GCM10027287_15720 [Bordetella muralis]|jgi:hypothetical protein
MTSSSDPDTSTSGLTKEIILPPGATQMVHGIRGTVLICVTGSVIQRQSIPRDGDAMPYIAQSPLRQGESYVFEDTHAILLRSEGLTHLLCIRPRSAWRVWARQLMQRIEYYAMITNIRRGVEQSGSSSGS